MDLVSAVQRTLSGNERCFQSIECGLVHDWVWSGRVLALVAHKDTEHGFFIYVTNKLANGSRELQLDRALPIDSEFKCDIEDKSMHEFAAPSATDVYLRIQSQKLKLLFEVRAAGAKLTNFVNEVQKALDAHSRWLVPPPDGFYWLERYNMATTDGATGDALNNLNSLLKTNISQAVSKVQAGFEDNFNDVLNLTNQKSSNVDRSDGAANSHIIEMGVPALDFVHKPLGRVMRAGIVEGSAPLAARESAVKQMMEMREDEYVDIRPLRLFVGTWNVNGQSPNCSLRDWLACDGEPPDIYAVGFQELDLSKEAFLFNTTPKEDEWLFTVVNGLHPSAEYIKLRLVRLVGIMLIVFVRAVHEPYIQDLDSVAVGTGILGKMGNKGGVSIRFNVHNTSLCFVCSHLAAHVEDYERRNQDYGDINARTVFTDFAPPKYIKDHNQIYWLGDLNYRLNDIDVQTVRFRLGKGDYESLLEHDQLQRQRKEKRVFIGYREGVIKFLPTYKYDPGTDIWDTSEKCRTPAWCDRVLFKGDEIELVDYRSQPKLLTSDHKPVSALFQIGVKVVDVQRQRRVHEEVMKKLDHLENEFLPQVTVDCTEFNLEPVLFNLAQTKLITVTNTGQARVTFEFIPKPNDSSFCKPWLTITPYAGTIMPGLSSEIELTVLVNKNTASELNRSRDAKLNDILVLHLDGGKDIFITISGEYKKSCFGSSLEALVHMYVPIRELQPDVIIKLETNQKWRQDSGEPLDVPKEIWLLVDHLHKQGLTQPHLFEYKGLMQELHKIRHYLDTGEPRNLPGGVNSVAEALLMFLDALAEPVIPYSFFIRAMDSAANFEKCKQISSQLPLTHKNTFKYLIAFLRDILLHSDVNRSDAKTLATVFGAVLLRAPPSSTDNFTSSKAALSRQLLDKKVAFVYNFLVYDYEWT